MLHFALCRNCRCRFIRLSTNPRKVCVNFPDESERLMKESSALVFGFAGQRARVPPDPIPNSEVKPCSVSSCSVVFGHVNLGKLAAHFNIPNISGIYTQTL